SIRRTGKPLGFRVQAHTCLPSSRGSTTVRFLFLSRCTRWQIPSRRMMRPGARSTATSFDINGAPYESSAETEGVDTGDTGGDKADRSPHLLRSHGVPNPRDAQAHRLEGDRAPSASRHHESAGLRID